jgi:hypothetical protein
LRSEWLWAALGGLVAIAYPVAQEGTDASSGSVPQQGEFRWTGRIAAGKQLEVRGTNGSVRVERATGAEVEVLARKSARRDDPDEVEIAVVPHDGGVTVCAVYPSPDEDRPNECLPGGGGRNRVKDNDVNVNFTVRLPDGVLLSAENVNGDVTVRDVTGDVEASTVNGDVDVVTRGVAEASTVNGSIRAAIGRSDWAGRMTFRTVNGGITLDVPAGLSARVEASTVNGGIETDFPITVQGRFGSRSLKGTIGDGARDLELATVNGSIRIRKAGRQ